MHIKFGEGVPSIPDVLETYLFTFSSLFVVFSLALALDLTSLEHDNNMMNIPGFGIGKLVYQYGFGYPHQAYDKVLSTSPHFGPMVQHKIYVMREDAVEGG